MNDEIQVFLELIKFIIIVSVILCISDALKFHYFRYFFTLVIFC